MVIEQPVSGPEHKGINNSASPAVSELHALVAEVPDSAVEASSSVEVTSSSYQRLEVAPQPAPSLASKSFSTTPNTPIIPQSDDAALCDAETLTGRGEEAALISEVAGAMKTD